MKEVHESFVGFAALLLDRYLAGHCCELSAFPVVTDVLRRPVAARLDADLPKQSFVTKVYKRHQCFGAAQPRQVKHHRISYACDIQIRGMDTQAADFPHVRPSRVGPLSGKLREYRKSEVFLIAPNRPKSAY